ncbi:MAG TPA: ParB/RepB/Spo0J family partition protein [Acidimicrobiales bacterium]|nr:ParB/RepB/Spo0J family partition protein [Acidimicrobiales bacterium]
MEATVLEAEAQTEAASAAPAYGQLENSAVRVVRVTSLFVGYSPRQTKVDPDHVATLADVADRLPPVVVDERTMTVIDGIHRLEAFRKLGRSHIPVVMFRGDEMEALVTAIQANIKHGKPLSRSERQAAARVVLGRCPERSDRWVGEVCGLSHTTVALLRRSLTSAEARVRTGRDGRRRPVDPTPGQAAVVRVLEDNPAASIRQAAGVAGVAPSTVQRVAAGLAKSQHQDPSQAANGEQKGPGPSGEGSTGGPPYQSFTQGVDAVSWLDRTSVTLEDLRAHLGSLPLSHVYEVADECRRRARTWAEMADVLEARVRRGPVGT